MKTLKVIMLCFIAIFVINTGKAQNSVVKEDFLFDVCGSDGYIPCTGDYVCGTYNVHFMTAHNNEIWKVDDAVLVGYKDQLAQEPSGNIYEISQIWIGIHSSECHFLFRLNGKLIGESLYKFHIIRNANGDLTAYIDKAVINCKK
jgi:hypothetical protein